MKKFAVLFLTLSLCLCSCAPKNARALTDEEIAQVNDAFFFMIENESGESEINPLTCMLMDYYDRPEEMPLKNFLQYFPAEGDVTTAEEFEALKTLADFPFQEVSSVSEMPVPLHRIPAADVKKQLQQYMNVSIDDLKKTDGVLYLDSYDAYYTYTSDAGGGYFNCESGELDDNTLLLYGSSTAGPCVITMKKIDNNWKIISHQATA